VTRAGPVLASAARIDLKTHGFDQLKPIGDERTSGVDRSYAFLCCGRPPPRERELERRSPSSPFSSCSNKFLSRSKAIGIQLGAPNQLLDPAEGSAFDTGNTRWRLEDHPGRVAGDHGLKGQAPPQDLSDRFHIRKYVQRSARMNDCSPAPTHVRTRRMYA